MHRMVRDDGSPDNEECIPRETAITVSIEREGKLKFKEEPGRALRCQCLPTPGHHPGLA
jgi:hypothetical protein